MPQFVAFLRAINVGGHVVSMEKLRTLFQGMDFEGVETFIASGNVIFQSRSKSETKLRTSIEKSLRSELGYEVATILRTVDEISEIATYEPFASSILKQATALNVGLIADALSASTTRSINRFKTEIDDFHVNGREIYWLCKIRQSDSTFSGAALERAIGTPVTFRNMNTIRRLAAKYSRSESET